MVDDLLVADNLLVAGGRSVHTMQPYEEAGGEDSHLLVRPQILQDDSFSTHLGSGILQ